MLETVAVDIAFGLGEPDRDHLLGVVPLVDGGGDVEPFVALQPDQPPAERLRQHLGDFGLADARLALEEDRPPHAQRQEEHRRERAVGEVIGLAEQRERLVDRGRDGVHRRFHGPNLYAEALQYEVRPPHAGGAVNDIAGRAHRLVSGALMGITRATVRRMS